MKCGAGGKVDKSHPHGLVSVAKVLVSINPPPHCGQSSRSTLSLQLRMHQLYEQKAWCHLYIHQSIKAFSAVCCVYCKHLSQSFVAFACVRASSWSRDGELHRQRVVLLGCRAGTGPGHVWGEYLQCVTSPHFVGVVH